MNRSYDGFQLKCIALGSMLIDHIAAVFMERYLSLRGGGSAHLLDTTGMLQALSILERIMRYVGRLSFPLFCFFLVEGFLYTSNRRRYALRLLLFAVLSEVPFDLAFYKSPFDLFHQNVLFTLLLGFLALWGSQALGRKLEQVLGEKRGTYGRLLSFLLIGALAVVCAEWLHTNYGGVGVATILILYFFRDPTEDGRVRAMLLGSLILLGSHLMEIFALADLPLIRRYNGKRGRSMRYFFYLFYPLHLLALDLLCRMTGC